MCPGSKQQPLDDVQCVAWNNQVQHILASTKLRSNIHEGMRIEDIIDTVKMLQQIKVSV